MGTAAIQIKEVEDGHLAAHSEPNHGRFPRIADAVNLWRAAIGQDGPTLLHDPWNAAFKAGIVSPARCRIRYWSARVSVGFIWVESPNLPAVLVPVVLEQRFTIFVPKAGIGRGVVAKEAGALPEREDLLSGLCRRALVDELHQVVRVPA